MTDLGNSNGAIKSALDTVLEQFIAYDAEKEQWKQEKTMLLQQMTEMERELNQKNDELQILSKRYKVLEMSLQSMNSSSKKRFLNNNNKNGLRKGNNDYISTTLPDNLDSPERLIEFMNNSLNATDLATDLKTQFINMKSKYNNNDPMSGRKNSKNKPKNKNNDGIYDDSKDGYETKNNDVNTNVDSKANMNLISREMNSISSTQGMLSSIESWINLRYHFDCIRCLCYDDSRLTSLLVAGSDDGVISLWNLDNVLNSNKLNNNSNNLKDIYDPWISFHGHKGSVISNCVMNGTFTSFENRNVFATGGTDGAILIWKAPDMESNNRSDFQELQDYRIGAIRDTNEIIWDINCHKNLPIIASVSADKYFKLFDISSTEDLNDSKILSCELSDYPSCVLWNSENSCVLGLSNGGLQHWDTNKGKEICTITDNGNTYCINKVSYAKNFKENLIYGVCSDNRLRCFDLRSKKCVIRQNVHTSSVNDLAILDSSMGYSIVTVADDCRMRAWNISDLRIIKELETIDTHRSKNNEGIMAVKYDEQSRIIITGGADGNVKLYRAA